MFYQDAEKYIKESFWGKSHDKNSTINIVDLVNDCLVKDNAEKDPEYYMKKPGVVHVSYLSKCLRGVALEMMGATPDEKDEAGKKAELRKMGVFKAGNLFEDFIIDTLGDKIIERQREYTYKYKSLVLVGRSDGRIQDGDKRRVAEVKSVHSDSFWYRQKSGELIAYHNQIQLQTYLWLERMLGISEDDGIFFYVSKDDCTVEGATIKYNPEIIEKMVIPALDLLNEAYEKKDPTICPLPNPVVFSDAKGQFQKNWLCTYCEYHSQCAGSNWILEATQEVARKNKELKAGLGSMPHMEKKAKPEIKVV